MDYNILILTYNSQHLIDTLIRHITHPNIMIVDNASSDGTVKYIQEQYPNIDLIYNKHNMGFGRFESCH